MTLADEYTNSILTDNANRALQGNVAMRVTQPGGQLWNQSANASDRSENAYSNEVQQMTTGEATAV